MSYPYDMGNLCTHCQQRLATIWVCLRTIVRRWSQRYRYGLRRPLIPSGPPLSKYMIPCVVCRYEVADA